MLKSVFSRCIAILVSLGIIVSLFIAAAPLSHAAESFYETAHLLKIKDHLEEEADLSERVTVQGACFDGEYAYFAVQNGTASLLKYRLSNMECVKVKKLSGLGHANDMTYNKKDKLIAVANNAPDYDIVTLIDPDSLEVKGTVQLEIDIYAIAYCEKDNTYYVGISGGYRFAKLDKDFNLIETYDGEETGMTRQGCDCDGDFLYFAQSGAGINRIMVYNLSGELVKRIRVENSQEIENIFHNGSDFYATLHYYGNYLYRLGLSDQKNIRFAVKYEKGAGEGEMADTSVTYGVETKLSKNTFVKKGYFFAGWVMKRDFDGKILGYRKGSSDFEWLGENELNRYALKEDEAVISDAVKIGNVIMTPFFIKEHYTVLFKSEGEGYMPPMLSGYDEAFALPENRFSMKGFVFDGYIASREADQKTYGFSKNSAFPEWLSQNDLDQPYRFMPGEEVSAMTYDGAVTFTADFCPAFSYSDDQKELVSYSGVDNSVDIPDNGGELTEISDHSFSDNPNISVVNFPSSVNTVSESAIENCVSLDAVTFSEKLPSVISGSAVKNSGAPKVYLKKNERMIFLGWLCDDLTIRAMRTMEHKLFE